MPRRPTRKSTARWTPPSSRARLRTTTTHRNRLSYSPPTGTATAVLCSTAGKNGRGQSSAAIGATVFWLTCPNVNNLIGRLEHHGAVRRLQEAIDGHDTLRQFHITSHAVYEQRVKELISAEQWAFFDQHFVHPEDKEKAKYGNAAVSHDRDMKCLHALAAQSLCGAANPCGTWVINYILFLAEFLPPRIQKYTTEDATTTDTLTEVHLCDPTYYTLPEEVERRACMDSTELLSLFLEQFIQETATNGRFEKITLNISLPATWRHLRKEKPYRVLSVQEIAELPATRDLCSISFHLIVYLIGKVPKGYKKNRLN
ncbi:hypothetical protein AGDE_11902 [Angomonas deanei]|uniref:Uncharacterized protein n=1 Tax=Angomonas deanei TaxID=59799 RepID=A0A7G2C5F5_9TRYP|nr:hypothetical protein AGDE_11902 [Angomonas deanei]CAD2214829.1 Protein of unknown function (DUF501), putative [Angomonas deanei]|eukprot:EPY25306.1 hypothetical protein AGDE_11902 [Angomonas deanei]